LRQKYPAGQRDCRVAACSTLPSSSTFAVKYPGKALCTTREMQHGKRWG
jgi:hypothetical protein